MVGKGDDMVRRGEALRDHILDAAKEAFLESGFERTSMDAVAARAQTSKRSLYAHFPTKDVLFAAVAERVRELFQGRLMTPEHYGETPVEAVTVFCGHFLQLLGWVSVARTCRLGIAEAERTPEVSARLYEAFFGTATGQLAAYLGARYELDDAAAKALAARLLGTVVYPALPEILFGVRPLRTAFPEVRTLADDVDLDAVRRDVAAVLATVKGGTAD
jgi:Transcriptional regulator